MKTIILTIALVFFVGCSQRIISYQEYDAEGNLLKDVNYKSNTLATDTEAGKIDVKTPIGDLKVDSVKVDNDSVEANTVIGGVPVGVKTGKE